MKKFINNSYWLLLLIPAFFVFKNLFLGNLFYGGDAPYFSLDTLSKLFSDPLVWTERGHPFGGINLALWLSPVMLVYGAMGKFLYLGNDAIIRIMFFIPSILLSYIGPYFLAKYLKLTKTVQFFAPLIYVFNTYFLLLLDGGQVGVALAYGIFPITLLFLKKFIDNTSKNNFLLALSFSFLLSMVDPRILIICFLTIFLWSILEKKFTLGLVLLGVLQIPLNFYWIYPLIKLGAGEISNSVSGLGLLSFVNPLMLFSPHWPANIFGKISYPPFYFVLVPIIIFSGLILNKDKKYLNFGLLFLIFAFLVKGETPPLGINLGVVFRDSSKFFIPLILFAGFLIGNTLDLLKNNLFKFIGFLYVLFLISPVFLGKMNFMMSNKTMNDDFSKISEEISSQDQEFRTVWFTNKNPLGYESLDNPAIDAISLANSWPIASMNASEDVFNFVNNSKFVDWFRVLGIKYVFLNGDHRNIYPTQTDIKSWNTINELFSKTSNLKKLDWDLNFTGYEITNPYPKFYEVNNLVAVVGSSELADNALTPSIYFEDGKWDPETLFDKKPDSIKVYFNEGEKLDLTMSFLQKHFISPSKNKSSEWSVFNSNDYLKYKYQLLTRDYKYSDFDYNQGIAFSSQKNESIIFNLDVPKNDDYKLAKRISNQDEKELRYNQKFTWQIEEKYLKKGSYKFVVTNNSKLSVLNTVALIPRDEYNNALKLTDQILDRFKVITKVDNTQNIKKVDIKSLGTSKYQLISKNDGYWVIFSDNYNSLWNLKRGLNYTEPYPVYSMINAFYVDPAWNNVTIEFRGQTIFRWGIWGSALTILIIIIYFLYKKENKFYFL